jgi:phosphohistidine phosphatase
MKAERKLLLLRHAKSAWPDGVSDRDRPLARRGRQDAPAAGRWLRQAGHLPDHVVCSTARRARETWQLARRELGVRPPVVYEPEAYQATGRSLIDLVRRQPPEARTVVLVGHDPSLPDLAVALAGEMGDRGGVATARTPATALSRMQAKFPTAAIAVLELSTPWSELTPGNARLAAFVTPRDISTGVG